MSQIVETKKKGRPSKADLARRAAAAAEEQKTDGRRSLRRRDARYTFDLDDFIDEEEEEEEDERRREKKKSKQQQLLKLEQQQQSSESGSGESARSRTRRVEHAPATSSGCEDGGKPLKRRKIDGDDEIDGGDEDDEVRFRRKKEGSKVAASVPGTPSDRPRGLPLPEKSSLELILDKLQKKDTYGVYAEPVDPDELPDYHNVIEHPMDFATVRKKLGKGLYSTLDQFESDVYLICTNAMEYNAPETIYYKQAHSIQELAKKKFQELRIDVELYKKELKSVEKSKSNSSAKQQIKMPMRTTPQEPVGSDFSSAATLATARDFQNGSNATRDGGFERLSTIEDGPVVGNTSLADNNLDKAEYSQGRVPLSRFGRKAFTRNQNRRSTYIISNQPIVGSKSVLATFDSEVKQLVAVGVHADHSYARSLALFAATLGPVAWKVASRTIEEALPHGFEYGRGWVGEYEPLPTPIVILENHSPEEPVFLSKTDRNSNPRKDDKTSNNPLPFQKHPLSVSTLQGNSSLMSAAITKQTVNHAESAIVSVKEPLEGKQPFFSSGRTTPTTSANLNYQQQSPLSRSNDSGKKVVKQLELNCTPISANQNACSFVTEKQISNGLDVQASQSTENVSRNRNLSHPVPLKQPENHGFVTDNSLDRNSKGFSSSDSITKQMVTPATYIPHGPEQGLSDPVQLMRMLAENAGKQQKSFNQSLVYNPSVMPPVTSSKRDDSNNASAAAAQAWMSIGSSMSQTASENVSAHRQQTFGNSLYNNPARELQQRVSQFQGDFPISGMQFQLTKNSPIQAFGTPPVQVGNGTHFLNREMSFPPSAADLSRFQMQSPWQGLNSQRQPSQKQQWLPPDLNIGVQSSGSPTGQSSGQLLDSQHPDLALQL